MSETPEDLLNFVKEYAHEKATYRLLRMISRGKYQLVGQWSPPHLSLPSSKAKSLYQDACRDMQTHKLDEGIYKLTIQVFKHLKSKHFSIQRGKSAGDRCDDCKGSGWYVGLVERRYCPTCDGSGKKP